MRTAARLILTLALLLAAVLPVTAQELKPKRVGVVLPGGPFYAGVEGLRAGLKAAGLEEGRQLSLLVRDTKGDLKAAEAAAKDLERDGVDVIVAIPTSVALATKRATVAVPIVFAAGSDPVAFGLVDSIARPGGRLTGVHFITADLTAKRLEILKELVPTLRRVVIIYNPDNPVNMLAMGAVSLARDAARQLGVDLVERQVTSPQDIQQRLRDLNAADADAFFFIGDPTLLSQIASVLDRLTALRMPTVVIQPDLVREGALAGYGVSYRDVGRMAAPYVARVLAGAQPGDLPVEDVSRVLLTINLKTAAALGLTIPPSILARADEVIE
jgi:putative tryptophan/tyrosine transport system substrate-binding protein